MFELQRSPVTLALCLLIVLATGLYGSLMMQSPLLVASDKTLLIPSLLHAAPMRVLHGGEAPPHSDAAAATAAVDATVAEGSDKKDRIGSSSSSMHNEGSGQLRDDEIGSANGLLPPLSAAERCPTPLIPPNQHIRSMFMPAFRLFQHSDSGLGSGGANPLFEWFDSLLSLGRGRHKRRRGYVSCEKRSLPDYDGASEASAQWGSGGDADAELIEEEEGSGASSIVSFLGRLWEILISAVSTAFALCVAFPLKFVASSLIALTPAELILSLFLLAGSGGSLEARLGTPRFATLLMLLTAGGALLYLVAVGSVTLLSRAFLPQQLSVVAGESACSGFGGGLTTAEWAASDAEAAWFLEVLGFTPNSSGGCREGDGAHSESSSSSSLFASLFELLKGSWLAAIGRLVAHTSRLFVDVPSLMEVYFSRFTERSATGEYMYAHSTRLTSQWLLVPSVAPLAIVLHWIYRLLTVTVAVVPSPSADGSSSASGESRRRQRRRGAYVSLTDGSGAGASSSPPSSAYANGAAFGAVIVSGGDSSGGDGRGSTAMSRRSSPCVFSSAGGGGGGGEGTFHHQTMGSNSAASSSHSLYGGGPHPQATLRPVSPRRAVANGVSTDNAAAVIASANVSAHSPPPQTGSSNGGPPRVLFTGPVRAYTLFGIVPLVDATIGNNGSHPLFQEPPSDEDEDSSAPTSAAAATDANGNGDVAAEAARAQMAAAYRASQGNGPNNTAATAAAAEDDDEETDSEADESEGGANSNQWAPERERPMFLMFAPGSLSTTFVCDLLALQLWVLSGASSCGWVDVTYAARTTDAAAAVTDTSDSSVALPFYLFGAVSYALWEMPRRLLAMPFSSRMMPIFWSVFILSHIACSSRFAKTAHTVFEKALDRRRDERRRALSFLYEDDVDGGRGSGSNFARKMGGKGFVARLLPKSVVRVFSSIYRRLNTTFVAPVKGVVGRLVTAAKAAAVFILSGGKARRHRGEGYRRAAPTAAAGAVSEAGGGGAGEDEAMRTVGAGTASSTATVAAFAVEPKTSTPSYLVTSSPLTAYAEAALPPFLESLALHQLPEDLILSSAVGALKAMRRARRRAEERRARRRWLRWQRHNKDSLIAADGSLSSLHSTTTAAVGASNGIDSQQQQQREKTAADDHGASPYSMNQVRHASGATGAVSASSAYGGSVKSSPPLLPARPPREQRAARRRRERLLEAVNEARWRGPLQSVAAWAVYGAMRIIMTPREGVGREASASGDRVPLSNAGEAAGVASGVASSATDGSATAPSFHNGDGEGNSSSRPRSFLSSLFSRIRGVNTNNDGSEAARRRYTRPYRLRPSLEAVISADFLPLLRSTALFLSSTHAAMGSAVLERAERVAAADGQLREEYRLFLNDHRHAEAARHARSARRRHRRNAHEAASGSVRVSGGEEEELSVSSSSSSFSFAGASLTSGSDASSSPYQKKRKCRGGRSRTRGGSLLYDGFDEDAIYDPYSDSADDDDDEAAEGRHEDGSLRWRPGEGGGVFAARAARAGGSGILPLPPRQQTNSSSSPSASATRRGGSGANPSTAPPGAEEAPTTAAQRDPRPFVSPLHDMILFLRHRLEMVTVTFVADSLVQTASNPSDNDDGADGDHYTYTYGDGGADTPDTVYTAFSGSDSEGSIGGFSSHSSGAEGRFHRSRRGGGSRGANAAHNDTSSTRAHRSSSPAEYNFTPPPGSVGNAATVAPPAAPRETEDLAPFAPSAPQNRRPPHGPSSSSAAASDSEAARVAQLVELGVDEASARSALRRGGGTVGGALAVLFD